MADLGAERAQRPHPERRADLPRIGDQQQFDHGPEVHRAGRAAPGGALAGGLGEANHTSAFG